MKWRILSTAAAALAESRPRPAAQPPAPGGRGSVKVPRLLLAVWLLATGWSAAELPDISTVAPDLTVPEMSPGEPAPGRRVRQTTPGWEATQVYHALYLPVDWKAGAAFPVIVEWAGNGGYRNAFGDESTGLVEGSKLGYGMTAGRGCIWVCLPYLNDAGTANVIKWWGDPPRYDPAPTLAYGRATVRQICEQFGGDATRVVLAGFSRGAIAVNYLGLHDEETARLWRAFICYSHYDGVRTTWPYPGADRASALARLERLAGRPQFICGEGSNAEDTERYLRETGSWEKGAFTIEGTGFRNHDDAWVLRPSEPRARLRAWLERVAPIARGAARKDRPIAKSAGRSLQGAAGAGVSTDYAVRWSPFDRQQSGRWRVVDRVGPFATCGRAAVRGRLGGRRFSPAPREGRGRSRDGHGRDAGGTHPKNRGSQESARGLAGSDCGGRLASEATGRPHSLDADPA